MRRRILALLLCAVLLLGIPIVFADSSAAAVYSKMTVSGSPASECILDEVFSMSIYIKGADDLDNITLPIVYDASKVVLLDKYGNEVSASTDPQDVLEINPPFELLSNGIYPEFDLTSGFNRIMLWAPSGNVVLNGNETLLCTFKFRAVDTGSFVCKIATNADPQHDPTSQYGIEFYNKDGTEDGWGAPIPHFPPFTPATFEIKQNKSAPPLVVQVLSDNTTVAVGGLVPGAAVTLYNSSNAVIGSGFANGDGVFALTGVTTTGGVLASQTEPNKLESDKTPSTTSPSTLILVSLEPNNVITVPYGTAQSAITMPSKIFGDIGVDVNNSGKVFILSTHVQMNLSTSWTCNNPSYDGDTARTYDFFASPALPAGVSNPKNLQAKQQVVVQPASIPGGPSGPGEVIYVPVPVPVDNGNGNGHVGPGLLNEDDHYRYLIGYEDGTIRPNNSITREEVTAIFYRLLTAEARTKYGTKVHSFPDVPIDIWSLGEIGTMANLGVIRGRGDGFFYPKEAITRAEFVAIATRFDVLIENPTHGFSDIAGHWAEDYIASAYQIGWVDGYEDGTFRPDDLITRSEVAKLINRVLKRRVDQVGLMTSIAPKWPDLPVEHWGYYELMEATTSHDYERRYDNRVMENWTGRANDINFSTTHLPTPSPEQLPVYQPSPVTKPQATTLQPVATPQSTTGSVQHKVVSGDSLLALAARYGTTVNAIKQLNGLTSDTIKIGQTLKIPQPSAAETAEVGYVLHKVVSGDSLLALAAKYGTTVNAIKQLNGLTSDTIKIGQTLKIPQ